MDRSKENQIQDEIDRFLNYGYAIAIVAMGRYMVVSSDHNALHQMMYAGAIFILVAALFLWKMRVRLTGWSAGKDNAD